MDTSVLPAFPYGAVYFRKSNPPREDWARDYEVAAQDGMNIFRHWLLWAAVETEPGSYDWADYDRQLELAARHGLKTIIAEMLTVAPEWAYRKYAHARFLDAEGRPARRHMHVSCACGGSPGLCLDNTDLKAQAGRFLRELAGRYKDHPGLAGYDIWNECNTAEELCYCPATAAKFREWLKKKYGDLKTLAGAWRRYGLAGWEDATPPEAIGPYPDSLDWLQFRLDNAYELMRWRAETIREVDTTCVLAAHGIAASLTQMAPRCACDWRAAAEVEVYGLTWGSSRHGDESWKQFHAVDLVRASSRGKPFWHAEAYAGPLWMQPQVLNKPRDEGRIAGVEDIRYWNLASFMAGASGLMYLRWRPLLDGPLFGAFGAYGMDGGRTERSRMASEMAAWTAAGKTSRLWDSRPMKGELGIVYLPETQIFLYAQQGKTDYYSQSMQGAYQGFFDLNIQADWVHIDHIDEYDLLYLPVPVMLSKASAEKLAAWVAKGGRLVCEGCPAYFGDAGRAGAVQPNLGLDALFGARESYVEFTPDLLNELAMNVAGSRVWGGLFLQAYQPAGGEASGWYEDGRIAAVDNSHGRGRTRLVGSMAGYGYAAHGGSSGDAAPPKGAGASPFFKTVLEFAGRTQRIESSDSRIKARLHTGGGGTILWVANPARKALPVRLSISPEAAVGNELECMRGPVARRDGCVVELEVPARDAAIHRLA